MNTNKKKIIACVAGRSGGHIIPCLTIAQRSLQAGDEILFFSSNAPLDDEILKNYPEITHKKTLTLINVPYKQILKMPIFALQCFTSFFKSFATLAYHRPERLITTGGYIAIPVCVAAKLLFIPIDIYELNVIPGKATKAVARIATSIFVCFSKTTSYFTQKTTLTHYPIRFTKDTPKALPDDVFNTYTPTKKTILILGGSQGSHFINQQVCQLISLYGPSLQIIHQTRRDDVQLLEKFYSDLGVASIVFSYQQNLAPYYQIANLVICRSGAGTLFETLFFKKRCITIPLETYTTDHQLDNAQALAQYYPELFSVIRQEELLLDPSQLFKTVSHLLG